MYSLWKTVWFFIIYFVTFGTCLEDDVIDRPVVHTKLGHVRGNTLKVLNSSVHIFYSIPFAKPPVGQLRFKHAVPSDPWNGTLDGTRKHNACFQMHSEESWEVLVPESEDCLYLNVFVPGTLAPINGNSSNGTGLPIIFFIYGGSFIYGSTSFEAYNSSILAVVNDVIVVTAEYRLGAFGYLFSGSSEAPGNAGLSDNLMALQWVQDNIRCFGGDPETVTILGKDAGSFSAGLLMLSPRTPKLFLRAILMSGSPVSFAAMSTSMVNSFTIIKNLGNYTNCNQSGNKSIQNIVVCLKAVSAEILDKAQESFRASYGPVLDGHFFPKRVENLYEEVVKKNISVILGVTKDEGSMFVAFSMKYTFSNAENLSVSQEELQNIKDRVMDLLHFNSMQKDAVNYVYGNWEDIYNNETTRKIASDFLGESMFVCPTNEFGHQLSDRNINVYYYKFNHRPSNSKCPVWAGVSHGEDLPFIFGQPLVSKSEYNTKESRLSYQIMKTFGNFAKFGIPTYEEVSWPLYSRDNQTYVTIELDGDIINKGPRAKQCALWNIFIPKLIEKEDCNRHGIVVDMIANETLDYT